MVTEYRIYKPIKAIDFLKSMHLSSKNIYKLFSLNALSTTKIIKEQDILENEILYINFSLLETNEELVPVKGKIDIIYEDSNFIALDKKANILIHSDGITNNTLLNYVVYYLQDKYDDSYPRPLHRIDYEAQGVVLFSKNVLAQAYVSYLLETNKVYKRYNVISMGHFPKETNNIKLNIAKDRHNSKKYINLTDKTVVIKDIKDIKEIINKKKSNWLDFLFIIIVYIKLLEKWLLLVHLIGHMIQSLAL